METMTNKEMELFNAGAEEKQVSVVAEDGTNLVMQLTENRVVAYSSLKSETFEDKQLLYNAQNNPDKSLADFINEVIMLKNVYVEQIQMEEEVNGIGTGKFMTLPRIVLIDDEGTSYQAVSMGIFQCLAKIFNLFGQPQSWGEGLPLKVKQVKTRKGYSALTLEIAKVEKKNK